MFLQVGYGLEGVLPDALGKRIVDEQIAPRFKAGDFDGGLTAGVQSIIAAVKGEYKGTGTTVAESRENRRSSIVPVIFFGFVIFMIVISRFRRFGNSRGGRIITGGGGWYGGGGGGWSGGGGGGGSGFSGGGGSFGGGGAGGSW